MRQDDTLCHGIFTYFLLDALAGKAAGPEGNTPARYSYLSAHGVDASGAPRGDVAREQRGAHQHGGHQGECQWGNLSNASGCYAGSSDKIFNAMVARRRDDKTFLTRSIRLTRVERLLPAEWIDADDNNVLPPFAITPRN